MGVDTVDRSFSGTIHIHKLDAFGPILERVTNDNDRFQSWVVLKKKDGEDTWSAVDDIDPNGLNSLSYMTEYELLKTDARYRAWTGKASWSTGLRF
jgi:hypothetical protein